MNGLHLHLILNHVPVVGTIFLVALFALAFARRDRTLLSTALVTCAVLGAVTVAVFLTGEPAEELVEDIAGISKGALERHEDTARLAMIAMAVAGALSLLALAALRRHARRSRAIALGGLAASIVLAGIMGVTANLGGQIRHAEIRASRTGH